jgi:serine phosphatase RsbU (regulator of sigma subunit)/predicted ester cyclase
MLSWSHSGRERRGGKEEEAAVSDAEEKNKALVRRFFEARVKRDLDTLDKMLAPDFVSHTNRLPGQPPDREGYKLQVATSVSAFSDVRFVIEDQIATGDKVVSRISGRGTHDRRELLDTAPTGREIASVATFIHRISEGKISEEWGTGTGSSELLGQRLEQEMLERERVEQELQVARSIQQASLPKEVPTLEDWQIAPIYRPARQVGGDFYDLHPLSESRLGLVVGDATGKGVPAALVMSTTLGMLRAVSQALDSSSPGELLKQVNEALVPSIPTNMFVTCFYAILDPKSGSLTYANAGHDLPYLHRNGEAEELRARGMPLRLMPEMGYEEKETILEAGEAALFFYSDGLLEAHNPKGEMFGFPRLQALVSEHSEEESLEEALLEELYSFVGEGWVQEDDITLLTLRRSRPEAEFLRTPLLGTWVNNAYGPMPKRALTSGMSSSCQLTP